MMTEDETPIWQNSKVGAAKRVAHYLATEVGEGEKFQKSTLREIVPGKEQVDRRMRDLRKVGWKIRNYKDKTSLAPNELFLEVVGDHVWEDGYKWPAEGLSAGKRREVLDRDGRRCRVCGIDFGAEFPDRPGVVARPTIGHVVPKERGGDPQDTRNLRAECQLCNETARNLTEPPADVKLLKRRIVELPKNQKQILMAWMLTGERSFTPAENLWARFNQLPEPDRQEVRKSLASTLGQDDLA